MTHSLISLSLATLVCMASASANDSITKQPRAGGIERKGYVWNTSDKELNRLLEYKASVRRGKLAYKMCKGCHLPSGIGLADIDYPQLAGQHASVLLKEMMDIRAGRRDNPRMYPFVGNWIVTARKLADISAY
jgi:cytochrome c553